jgi:glutamine synthetase
MKLEDFQTIRVAAADVNGRLRGKRIPGATAGKIDKGGLRMPLAALFVDITGADVLDAPIVLASGDADGVLRPTERGPVPMPWLEAPSALVPVSMFNDDGAPYAGDPRHALAGVLDGYAARGWRVMAAVELEFYLTHETVDGVEPAVHPGRMSKADGVEILSIDELDAFDGFFTALYAGAAAMGIEPLAAISEAGPGQFEVNLNHADAMRVADDAVLFKSLVKGTARRHGMVATFLPKPYPDESGSGLHVHFSVVDAGGSNVFDDGTETGNDLLRHAVAGCLRGMAETSIFFFPHPVSYDRLVPGAHAPTGIGWGYENRTAAIRIPGGSPKARRIEHRVAGGDICPYLMLAAVLGAALAGIEDGAEPPAPITGNAYEADLPQIPGSFEEAIRTIKASEFARRFIPAFLIDNFVLTKMQELARVNAASPQERLRIYLERV